MFTGLLITALILAGVITAVGGGMVMMQRRRELTAGRDARALLPAGTQASATARTVSELRLGDIVAYAGIDFVVEGVVSYDEEGHCWNAGRMVDGNDKRWLLVGLERDRTVTMRVLTEAPDIDMSGYPPEVLIADGARYTLDQRGTATVRTSGDIGLVSPSDAIERCRWWLYTTPGDKTLVVEQWGNTYRVLRGRVVEPLQVDLIPGS